MNQCNILSCNEIRATKFFKKCEIQTKNQTPGQQDEPSICRNSMLVWRQYMRQTICSRSLICMVVVSWPLWPSYWANSENSQVYINTLRPRQNGHHVTDNNFKRIFLNINARISTRISRMFVPKGRVNTMPALVQIMAWCRPGNKPLSEPMMVRLQMHICVHWPQWVSTCIIWDFS